MHPKAERAPPDRARVEFFLGNWVDLDGGSEGDNNF